MTVLFWDIDGTLLTTARAGVFALEGACEAVSGRAADLQSLKTDGLTDHQIAIEILRGAGVPPDGATLRRFIDVYESLLPSCLPRREGRVLAGVHEVLAYFHGSRRDVRQMLLTGNTPAGARAKLTHYGLWDYFDGGAFSEDTGPRTTIAVRALGQVRARFSEDPVDPRRLFVIGDTPHDIQCAAAIGARAIALATGAYDEAALAALAPWKVLPELPAPQVFASIIDDAVGAP